MLGLGLDLEFGMFYLSILFLLFWVCSNQLEVVMSEASEVCPCPALGGPIGERAG